MENLAPVGTRRRSGGHGDGLGLKRGDVAVKLQRSVPDWTALMKTGGGAVRCHCGCHSAARQARCRVRANGGANGAANGGEEKREGGGERAAARRSAAPFF
ncbi:hypothetical protein FGB62_139g241 [Gracilaria domingensis]|nr:hypothetical protein FGB62_139g241 [Gracilaria domingensis]